MYQKVKLNSIAIRRLFLVITIFLAQVSVQAQDNEDVGQYRSSRTRYMDLIHTKLEVSFDWEHQYLNGIATLDLTPYFFPQSDLVLDAKGMDIHSVHIQTGDKAYHLPFTFDGNELEIDLEEEFTRGDTLRIKIAYQAKPNERKVGGSDAIKSDKGLYFINPLNEENGKPQQIWTQGETESNSVWFPTIDAPNERCTQEMYITVGEKFKTLSNGLLIRSTDNLDGTRTDYWNMDLPHAPYLFMMAVGEFASVEDKWNGISLTYMVEPEYQKYAKDIFGNTPEMMTFFSELLGVNYPWQKYTQVVVRDYVSGAMENTTASVFMEGLQANRRELMDESKDDIIAHELFHQGVGDLVTTESWSNVTLNEGFATYSEYLWDEHKYGVEMADYNFLSAKEGYLDEAKEDPKSLIRYYYDTREDMFDRHSYNKGGWVVHMLRNYVGDEAFFASLNLYLIENAFQSVEINDLRLAFEEVTGEDLNWFFDQWFELPGHPEIRVNHDYKGDTLQITVEQVQDENTHLFRMPVFVEIFSLGEKLRFPLIIEEEYETYKFPLTKKPDYVLFDSEMQLLAEIEHSKSDKELLSQFLLAGSYGARLESMEGMANCKNDSILNAMVNLGLDDSFFDIRLSALSLISDGVVKSKKYEEKLVAMLADSNSYVKAEVLSILTEFNFKKYAEQLQLALSDSSYYVIGAVIQMLSESKETLNSQFIETFKKDNNIHVTIALAAYFSAKKQFPEYDWYIDKMTKNSGSELFYFIQYFSEKLLESPQ
ncbi:MAG: M1 family metallopeptidase, partial [Cyclobacteriaceae bacterium]|nr:M1 family metallopeptidase [Cyclobacteriaceae bacterium]